MRSQIGKGGDQLMPVFLSKEEIDSRGQEIEEYRSKLYKQQYLPKVRGFPEVWQLIERIKRNGLKVVLASSAKSDELQILSIYQLTRVFLELREREAFEEKL